MPQETVLKLARYFHVLLPGVLVADAVHNACVVHKLWQARRKEWLQEDQEALLANGMRTLQQVSTRCGASAFWPRSIAAALQPGETATPVCGPKVMVTSRNCANGLACALAEDATSPHLLCGSTFLGSVLDGAADPPIAAPDGAVSMRSPELEPAAPVAPLAWQLQLLAALQEQIKGLAALLATRVPAAWLRSSATQDASPAETHAPVYRPLQAALAAPRGCQQALRRGWDAACMRMEGAACGAAAAAQGALPLPRVAVVRRSALRFRLTWMGLRWPPPRARLPLELVLPSQ